MLVFLPGDPVKVEIIIKCAVDGCIPGFAGRRYSGNIYIQNPTDNSGCFLDERVNFIHSRNIAGFWQRSNQAIKRIINIDYLYLESDQHARIKKKCPNNC